MAGANDIIGNYRLVKELSSGVYSRIYQADISLLPGCRSGYINQSLFLFDSTFITSVP
jgi:hypothetical protein